MPRSKTQPTTAQQATPIAMIARELVHLREIETTTDCAGGVLRATCNSRETTAKGVNREALLERVGSEASRRRAILEDYAMTQAPETLADVTDLLTITVSELNVMGAPDDALSQNRHALIERALQACVKTMEKHQHGGRLGFAYGRLYWHDWAAMAEDALKEARPFNTSNAARVAHGSHDD